MELMNTAFGAKQVQKDQQSHHKSHRAVFAYELDFLVGDAVRSGCVWASYFKLDVGVDGEKLAEQEGLDLTAAHGSSQRRTLDLAARCDHMALWASFDAFPARNRLSARHDSTIPCVPIGPPIRCREVPHHRALKAALGFGTAPVLRARPYISAG